MIDCVKCNKKYPIKYKHCLNAMIHTVNNNIVQCIIRDPLLDDIFPSLTNMEYETSLQLLPNLRLHSKFIMNKDKVVLHIGLKEEKKVSLKLEPPTLLIKLVDCLHVFFL
jgi:hypothetical protein